MVSKRYPLPKRFSVALSESAYKNLRALNSQYQYGNNYLLTILLENIDEIADQEALAAAYERFKKEYGAPEAGTMKKKGGS